MFCWVEVLEECYKSLKDGLGTHAASYGTVHWWVHAIKNGLEETGSACCSGAPTLAMDESHMDRVKSVLENVCSISCMTVATSRITKT